MEHKSYSSCSKELLVACSGAFVALALLRACEGDNNPVFVIVSLITSRLQATGELLPPSFISMTQIKCER
ncbi:hypothetical protein O6H91_11G116400 [Diphasiastrum complanatum]|uniref:Uncharacterized protein n=1 Tax=Diphasiastrum complanatum TaxID=34168 RepID=A0ACC2CDA0_DIPCM|nr:hypothetical protein O6H91_11G116400 [Diphasiastrum complanatum]